MESSFKQQLKEHTMVVFGTALAALGLSLFLSPNQIAPGGLGGLATILHHTANLPIGATMLVVNIILLSFAFRSLGRGFVIKTLYSMVLFSVIADVTQYAVMPNDLFLSTIYGGVLQGIGIGIVYRASASTGGTDLAAHLLHRVLPSIGTNWILFGLDFVIVVLAALSFGSERALYALASIFISSKLIEIVSSTMRSTMAFYIISSKPKAIADRVISELHRGITMLAGRRMYKNEERDVLFCVLEGRHQAQQLRKIVKEEDKRAFMVMSAVREVLGEGFRELQ